MPRAYFDTQVYDRIAKGEIPDEDVEALRPLIARRKITAHLSVVDVEELLGEWTTDPAAAIRKIIVARDLVGFNEILKQPRDILTDAIHSYAEGVAQPSPFLAANERDAVVAGLHRLISGDAGMNAVVSDIVRSVCAIKQQFVDEMLAACGQARADWQSVDADRRRETTFAVYWQAGALQWAEDYTAGLVERRYVERCRDRGFGTLLDIRPVRLCVGATMSWIFSVVVGDGNAPRQPRRTDGYDLWHATTASAADLFVTYDKRLADLVERVPIDNFRVVRSLSELLRGSLC